MTTTCPTTAAINAKIAQILRQTSSPGRQIFASDITSPLSHGFAQTIDHTLLKPDATDAQIDALCEEARRYGFKSCCVNSSWVKRVAQNLAGSGVLTCCVVGFPLGAMAAEAKAFETSLAVQNGAQEIDTVLAIGQLKSANYPAVYADIAATVAAAAAAAAHHTPPAPAPAVKVIIETALLTDEQKIAACYIAAEAGAAFVKTCTGFSGGGATVRDVHLMMLTVLYREGRVKVKASAAIRDFVKCREMLQAGADRIGTSSGVQIMEGA